MMVFTYLLGWTDAEGRNVIEMWVDKIAKTRRQSAVLSVIAVIVVGDWSTPRSSRRIWSPNWVGG